MVGTCLATGGVGRGSGTPFSLPRTSGTVGAMAPTPMALAVVARAVASAVCGGSALPCIVGFRRRLRPLARAFPPVTVLKPLCGTHPALYESLRSFCDQDYPE